MDYTFHKDTSNIELSHSSLLSTSKPEYLACEVLHSAAYNGIQAPVKSLSQIADRLLNTKLEKHTSVLLPPVESEFASPRWHAQQIGGAVGMLLPFLLVHKGVASLSRLAVPKETMVKHILDGAVTGAVYEGAFRPVAMDDKNAFATRAANSLNGALTFGTLTAASIGLRSYDPKTGAKWMRHMISSAVGSGIIASIPAGFVSAEATSLLQGHGLATPSEIGRSMYGFAFVAGALSLSKGMNNETHIRSNSSDISKPQTKANSVENRSMLDRTPGESKPVLDKTPGESKPVLDKTLSESKPVLDETPGESKPVLDKTLSESKPVLDETPGESKPVLNETPGESKPVLNKTPSESKPVFDRDRGGKSQLSEADIELLRDAYYRRTSYEPSPNVTSDSGYFYFIDLNKSVDLNYGTQAHVEHFLDNGYAPHRLETIGKIVDGRMGFVRKHALEWWNIDRLQPMAEKFRSYPNHEAALKARAAGTAAEAPVVNSVWRYAIGRSWSSELRSVVMFMEGDQLLKYQGVTGETAMHSMRDLHDVGRLTDRLGERTVTGAILFAPDKVRLPDGTIVRCLKPTRVFGEAPRYSKSPTLLEFLKEREGDAIMPSPYFGPALVRHPLIVLPSGEVPLPHRSAKTIPRRLHERGLLYEDVVYWIEPIERRFSDPNLKGQLVVEEPDVWYQKDRWTVVRADGTQFNLESPGPWQMTNFKGDIIAKDASNILTRQLWQKTGRIITEFPYGTTFEQDKH